MSARQSFAERVAHLDAAKRKIEASRDQAVKAAQRQEHEAIREARDATADAERRHEEELARVDAEIVGELKERIYPLAAKFGETPRATAADIATAWRELSERCHRELDDELAMGHLALAFLEAMGAVSKFGAMEFMSTMIGPGRSVGTAEINARRLIAANAATASIEEALRDLEAAAATVAASFRYGNEGQARAWQACAGTRRAAEAWQAEFRRQDDDQAMRGPKPGA